MASLLKKTAPWLLAALAFPALFTLDALFVRMFPASPHAEGDFLQSFLQRNTLQTAYVYEGHTPGAMAANFYFSLGTQLAARGQLLAAEKLLGDAVRLTPGNAAAQMNYGVVLEALDRFEPAIEAYRAAARVQPDDAQAYYSLGLLLDKTGRSEEGVQSLLQALKNDPSNRLINYDLGVLYAKRNDYERSALYSLKAAEAGAPDFAEAYNNYGYALANLGKFEESLKAIEQSLRIKPDSAAALDSKGFALAGLGRCQEALAEYEKALKIDPAIGEIYLHKAQALEKLQRMKDAVQAYETYIQLTPKASDKEAVEAKISELKKWIVPPASSQL